MNAWRGAVFGGIDCRGLGFGLVRVWFKIECLERCCFRGCILIDYFKGFGLVRVWFSEGLRLYPD